MSTETKLLATVEQARAMANELISACQRAKNGEGAQYVRVTLELMAYDGPWRLVIGVIQPDAAS